MWNRFDFLSVEWELWKITGSTGTRSKGNKLLRRTWMWQGRTGMQQEGAVGTCPPGAERWEAAWAYPWSYRESCLPPPCGCQSLSHQCHSRVGLQLHTALLCPGSGPTDLGQPAEPWAWDQQNHPASHCSGAACAGASGELSAHFPCTAALSTEYLGHPGFLGTNTNGRGVQQVTSLTPGKCPTAGAPAAVCTAKRQSWPGGNGSSPNTVWRYWKSLNQSIK